MGQMPSKKEVMEEKGGRGQKQGRWAQAGLEGCLGIPTEWMLCVKKGGLALTS